MSTVSNSSSCHECGCHALGGHRSAARLLSSHLLPSDASFAKLYLVSLSSSSIRCPVCVDSLLKPHLERYQQALQERNAARANCARELERLRHGQSTLSELQFESQRLLDRLGSLQKECSTLAVQVTAKAVENEDRQQARQQHTLNIRDTQQQLDRLRESVCEGALHGAIVTATEQVRGLRFQWAMRAFVMHRLDVDYDHEANNNNNKHNSAIEMSEKSQHPAWRRRQHARGIGKIGGLPLPHAGPELYGVLPPRELQSALRLVASLTCTVARCLAIVLPHPILLKPNKPNNDDGIGDIIDTVAMKQQYVMHTQNDQTKNRRTETKNQTTTKSEPVGSSSTSSLMSLMEITTTSFWGRSAKNALAKVTGQAMPPADTTTPFYSNPSASMTIVPSPPPPPPVNDAPAVVAHRLLHASCAVLAEDSKSNTASRYALSQSVMHQEEFAIALQLLQNNVVALCIRAGVPVNHLFPAEALLLNLHALAMYCQEQVNAIPW